MKARMVVKDKIHRHLDLVLQVVVLVDLIMVHNLEMLVDLVAVVLKVMEMMVLETREIILLQKDILVQEIGMLQVAVVVEQVVHTLTQLVLPLVHIMEEHLQLKVVTE